MRAESQPVADVELGTLAQGPRLDDEVPVGSTTQQAFALMQQQRIDALESDVTKILHTLGVMPTPPAAIKAPKAAAPPPDSVFPTWPGWSGGCSSLTGFFCMGGLMLIAIVISMAWPLSLGAGLILLAWGTQIGKCNTPSRALVTFVADYAGPSTLDCAHSIIYMAHDNAMHNHTVTTPSTTFLCNQSELGSIMDVCYHWQDPDTFCMGSCGLTPSYAIARACLTASIVMMSVGLIGWLCVILGHLTQRV